MKKAEIIERYGEEEYKRLLEQRRAYYKAHRKESKAYNKKYREEHREEKKVTDKRYYEEHRDERKVTDKRYYEEHREEVKERVKKWAEEHPEEVIARQDEQCRKGGKYYERNLKNEHIGLRGAKNKIRVKHANKYRPYKDIIAPDSQLHHQWKPDSAEYTGVALVEKDQHQHGYIDVIQILNGKITLLTEEEVRNGKKNEDEKEAETALV